MLLTSSIRRGSIAYANYIITEIRNYKFRKSFKFKKFLKVKGSDCSKIFSKCSNALEGNAALSLCSSREIASLQWCTQATNNTVWLSDTLNSRKIVRMRLRGYATLKSVVFPEKCFINVYNNSSQLDCH